MKKYDYDKIEKWAADGFEKSKTGLKYRESAADKIKESTAEKTKKGGGTFYKPALQLAGVFLIAVLVGGGTFGVLKYMEHKGAGTNPPVTDTVTAGDVVTKPAETEIQIGTETEKEAVNKVLYSGEGDGTGFVTLRTGESCYTPGLFKSKACVRTSETSVEDEKYDYEWISGGTYDYEGDIELINNVSDREMTVLSASYLRQGDDVWCGTHTVEGLQNAFDKNNMGTSGKFVVAPDGVYHIEILVTWDDPDLSDVGDRYDVYEIHFLFNISGRNTFKSGVYIKNYKSGESDTIDLNLPIDNYEEVKAHENPAAKTYGLNLYSYIRTDNQSEQLCITGKNGELLFNSDTPRGAELQDSIVYAVGQSGEKMFFYTEKEMITFSGRVVPLTSLYRYDVNTHTKELLTQIGPDAYVTDTDKYQKMIWETYTGFSYYVLYGRLFLGVAGIDETVPNFDVVSLKSAEITYENGKYVIEDPYPNGFLNVPHHESFDYAASDALSAYLGSTLLHPDCIGWVDYKDGIITDENYLDIASVDYIYNDPFYIFNSLRNTCSYLKKEVNGKDFGSVEALTEYVGGAVKSGEETYFNIIIEVSWSGEENIKAGNYTKYVFALNITVN